MSDFERLRIVTFYDGFVTGDLEKRIEGLKLLKQRYPEQASGATDLALTLSLIGRAEEAVAEAQHAIRVNPAFGPARWALGLALLRSNRFTEAKKVFSDSQMDLNHFHSALYQIAFLEGAGSDTPELRDHLEWARRKEESSAFEWQASSTALLGEWRKSQQLSLRAIDLATRDEMKELAARYAAEQALRGAVLGNCRQARANVTQALSFDRGRVSLPGSALALAICGDQSTLIEELSRKYPQDTLINRIWLPTIRAATEMHRNQPAQAVEHLQTTSRYEAAAEFWPQYLRGISYLQLNKGPEAAGEFQKILDHRGEAPLSVLYPLAYLGHARAGAISGDLATSRRQYAEFLTLWKNADSDLPVLIQAKKEFGQ